MGRVYVARHGETNWNRAGRYQGQQESDLTELGRRQAVALSNALAASNAVRIVASPLQRCVQTAQPLAERLNLEVETDSLLLDIAHGTWEGRLKGDLAHEDPVRVLAWRAAPHTVRFDGGEALEDVARRWQAFVDSFQSEGDVAIVTHDEVLRIAILWATNRPHAQLWEPRVINGGYAIFNTLAPRWSLLEECREDHLAGILADAARQAL
jgi:phosphoserine phosphatase